MCYYNYIQQQLTTTEHNMDYQIDIERLEIAEAKEEEFLGTQEVPVDEEGNEIELPF